MMKKAQITIGLCLLMALFISNSPVKAQLFDEGDVVVSAGIGVGSTLYSYGGYNTSMPLLFASGDYCLREDLGPGNLGVGAILGYTSYKVDWVYDDYRINTFIFGARGTYHFTDLVDKLDLYGGITIGAKIGSDNYSGPYGSTLHTTSGFMPELFAGARYYFADNIGVMGELAYGIYVLKAGISFKF
jgi:Outer membrane protein beta-barrel domain